MDMYIDATGRDNVTFAGDHLGSRSDDYIDVRLHIGIASLAFAGNTPFLDWDVSLHYSPVIENQGVGDDRIDRALAARTLRLTNPTFSQRGRGRYGHHQRPDSRSL